MTVGSGLGGAGANFCLAGLNPPVVLSTSAATGVPALKTDLRMKPLSRIFEPTGWPVVWLYKPELKRPTSRIDGLYVEVVSCPSTWNVTPLVVVRPRALWISSSYGPGWTPASALSVVDVVDPVASVMTIWVSDHDVMLVLAICLTIPDLSSLV